jgi:signal transduction histidine kinase
MSHELRTPLNAIMGFSELMAGQMLGPLGTPVYLEYSRDIHTSAGHLLAIISDILDIAKVEAGKVILAEEEVLVAEEAAAALRLVGPRAEEQAVFLRSELPKDLPMLRGDARLVKQMLLNLLTNAVKFTPAGGLIVVAAELTPEGDLAVRISDTGIGIPPADLTRVLQPFGQVEGACARRHGGIGLGLPLVKSFVELHGGRLTLVSELGKGTTVRLVFPKERVLPALQPTEAVLLATA